MEKEQVKAWLNAYGIDGKQVIKRNNGTQFIENLMTEFANQVEQRTLISLKAEISARIINFKNK